MSRGQMLSLAVAAVFFVALSLALIVERTVNSILNPERFRLLTESGELPLD